MYIFEKIEGEDNVYKFQTKKGFLYEIYFVEAHYYFPDNWQFKHQVYEFVVKLSNDEKLPPNDDELPETIATIFLDFFQNHEKVAVYSCDTTDGKQAARHRKFTSWFHRFNNEHFMKYDGIIEDEGNNSTYFMSIILQDTNPYKFEIIEAFKLLTVSLSENKP